MAASPGPTCRGRQEPGCRPVVTDSQRPGLASPEISAPVWQSRTGSWAPSGVRPQRTSPEGELALGASPFWGYMAVDVAMPSTPTDPALYTLLGSVASVTRAGRQSRAGGGRGGQLCPAPACVARVASSSVLYAEVPRALSAKPSGPQLAAGSHSLALCCDLGLGLREETGQHCPGTMASGLPRGGSRGLGGVSR